MKNSIVFGIKKLLAGLSNADAQEVCDRSVREFSLSELQGTGLKPSLVPQCANTFRQSRGKIENDKEVEDSINRMPYLNQTEMLILLINEFGAERTPSKATLNRDLMKQQKALKNTCR